MEEVRYIEEVRKKFGTKNSLLGREWQWRKYRTSLTVPLLFLTGDKTNRVTVTRLVLSPVRKRRGTGGSIPAAA